MTNKNTRKPARHTARPTFGCPTAMSNAGSTNRQHSQQFTLSVAILPQCVSSDAPSHPLLFASSPPSSSASSASTMRATANSYWNWNSGSRGAATWSAPACTAHSSDRGTVPGHKQRGTGVSAALRPARTVLTDTQGGSATQSPSANQNLLGGMAPASAVSGPIRPHLPLILLLQLCVWPDELQVVADLGEQGDGRQHQTERAGQPAGSTAWHSTSWQCRAVTRLLAGALTASCHPLYVPS